MALREIKILCKNVGEFALGVEEALESDVALFSVVLHGVNVVASAEITFVSIPLNVGINGSIYKSINNWFIL